MEVSPQDPPLMAMDLSKSYSVNPLTRSHTEAMDLAKKPEWYHRRPPSCSTDISSPYRSRASSSYSAPLHPEPGAPVHCRDPEQGPESLGDYVNSSLAPGLDLYRDAVHGSLWHSGFYGPDQTGGPLLESSGGEESDSGSGSDVIFLVSSAKEPLLCTSFLQDSVRHIVEPLTPVVSSLEAGRGCYHLPQPLSSPSPDSSYSEDSSDSSVDIPVHHTRPVVLLSDLGAVYGNPAGSPVDMTSDDSDIIEVSVTSEKKKTFPCKKKSLVKETAPQSEDEKVPLREVRRSPRIRKSVSETPPFTCSVSRHSLRRQAKSDAVGIYNECCDSDDMMDYTVRLFSSDADEESASQPTASQRASSNSEESDVDVPTDRKSPQRESEEQQNKASNAKSINKGKKPPTLRKAKSLRTKQKENCSSTAEQHKKKTNKKPVARRKKRGRSHTGPSALFSPREPEIKLKYANMKREKKIKKLGSFCPFVHVRKRMCTVVNDQEEEETVRSSRGRQQKASSSPPGFLPSSSCFQLGRFGSDGRSPMTPLCCLCGQTANATGLGDLHGPYYPTNPSLDHRTEQKEEEPHLLVSRRSVNSSEDGLDGYDCSAVKGLLEGDGHSLPKEPLRLDEGWIHEDCGIWSAGVFLVRGKLYGLEEAARLAQETMCSACQQTGAIIGCFQKGCPRNYHYRCAVQSGCVLNEENFSIRCPEHKNKLLTVVTRQHKR
ncbi:transcription factor 20 [Anarrhichthys ocellatus]|uniref:transcription factor 20 n=1 Tax=Anarrhichthys ocellatus TaxID=433405 RepID=UPI0012EDF5FD|nr:transcription factor 20-like [Anarrhichthys ocellatus]XP_031717719.1 transcription factor 20-like [Anarrhichthys ocellatus]XP_031717720.1 transcription factor 20-like [Anarrhichthys ocellatus]